MIINSRQFFLSLILSSFIGGLLALGISSLLPKSKEYDSIASRQNAKFSKFTNDSIIVPDGLNFIHAAELVRPAVVHVRVSYATASTNTQPKNSNPNQDPIEELFRRFHGGSGGNGGNEFFEMPQPRGSSGSGVIISDDGYIATNNHVIEKASSIEVVMNDKKSYKAKVVGKDPTTDLALLKIEETNLPFVSYGDSEKLRVGEWVLAVGNPFDLTSTVTAGIVSAKGRNINLLRSDYNGQNYAIESFIQTDAAVNPGNSGGALVNLKGELVGINTAIASQTGSFAGYSFAVPVDIVKKIMDDLLKYGESQRALLGVSIQDINAELVEKNGLKSNKGVYVGELSEGGAAKTAGIQKGDVITAINGREVNSTSELQAVIGTKRPGEVVSITLTRGSKEMTVDATLKNKQGTIDIVKTPEGITVSGAEFGELSPKEMQKLGIEHGVKVSRVGKSKLAEAGIKDGFIITYIGDKPVYKPEDIETALQERKRVIAIEGMYANGNKAYYAIGSN